MRVLVRLAIVSIVVGGWVVAGPSATRTDHNVVHAVGEATGAGGEFHPVTPARIFDSRNAVLDVEPFGRKATGPVVELAAFDIPILGMGGLPEFVDADLDGYDDNLLAVVLNITVIGPTQSGYVRAFGSGSPEGESSVVNFAVGETVPNSAVLRPGSGGELTIRVFTRLSGTADIAVDVLGWFSSSMYPNRGARLTLAGPGRVFDSRLAAFGGLALAAGSTTRVPIRGVSSTPPGEVALVPNDPMVTAVMVNITGVNSLGTSTNTFVSATPEDPLSGQVPSTSNLNLVRGATRANLSIVPIGADGAIRLFNRSGNVHLIVDVVAYFVEGTPVGSCAGRVIPLVTPFRAFDTRGSEFFNSPLGPNQSEDWSFDALVNDVRVDGNLVGPQIGLLGTLTATNLRRQYSWVPVRSFLSVTPVTENASSTLPSVSNVNFGEGQSVPNLALLGFGTNSDGPNRVRFLNRAGYVDYLFDVSAVILAECAG